MTLFKDNDENFESNMLQSLFRRGTIERAYRFLPVLKNSCKHFETAVLEAEERYGDIDRYRVPKTYQKKFIENLFLGLYEYETLEYPQIRTKPEVDYLQGHGQQANSLMLHEIDVKEIETTGKITRETFGRLQENNLLGMKIKLKDEGLGYFESESSYIQEFLYLSSSLSKAVAENESSGYQILRLFGTDQQKEEYIPKILKGECISCLAHLEKASWISQGSSPIMSTATKQEDGSFIISGRKTLVYNPSCSDILIVSARVSMEGDDDFYTLFIVDKNSEGVSVLEPLDKFSLKGTEICDVVFDKVVVSGDKVIGNINEGSKIIDKLISLGKLSNGAQCIGLMRKLVNDAITHCIVSEHFNKPLYKFKYVQGKIGEIIQALYAAESMTYLMYGRVDEDPNLDAKLESFIVKIFNSEALNFILYNYMHLVGKEKCNDEFIQKLIMDAPFFAAFDDPNTCLKMSLATTGVKHTMDHMTHRRFKKYKPKSKIKLKFLEMTRNFREDQLMKGYLHLTLQMESKLLGYCIQTLNFLTEILIHTHGNEALSKPYYLSQLADLTIIIYKLSAVLGRSSRSYCIGLRHSEADIRVARNITQNGYQRAETILNDVLKTLKNEPTYKNVGNYVSSCGKFSHSHPAEPIRKVT